MGPCCLVFGVSGVGKTTACIEYVKRHPGVLFVSASTLLKSVSNLTDEALRTANAEEIVANQRGLADALYRFREGRSHRPILVDAHGVIDNDRELTRVPLSAIRALEPSRLVLLEALASEVAERRGTDSRHRPKREVREIVLEMAAERDVVSGYAEAMGMVLSSARVGPAFTLDAVLKGFA